MFAKYFITLYGNIEVTKVSEHVHPHILETTSIAQVMTEQQVAGEHHFNML